VERFVLLATTGKNAKNMLPLPSGFINPFLISSVYYFNFK
jgi:hypothetical protein